MEYKVDGIYRLVQVFKQNGIAENQKGVFKVKNGKVYTATMVRITSITDRGDCYCVSYRPTGKDTGRCAWGVEFIYKQPHTEWDSELISIRSCR
jgi:hypothetical protein